VEDRWINPDGEAPKLARVNVSDWDIDEAASSESGQGLVEYGLIIFLVAIVVIAIFLLVGPRIGSIFSRITRLG